MKKENKLHWTCVRQNERWTNRQAEDLLKKLETVPKTEQYSHAMQDWYKLGLLLLSVSFNKVVQDELFGVYM